MTEPDSKANPLFPWDIPQGMWGQPGPCSGQVHGDEGRGSVPPFPGERLGGRGPGCQGLIAGLSWRSFQSSVLVKETEEEASEAEGG